MRFDTVNFLTDYGTADEFVAVTKSVIWSIAPSVRVVDVTHEIAPHNVRAGGLALARSAPYLNPGVVIAVVDPGVGGDRRGVAVEVGGGSSVLIGPDNGLLAPTVALVGGATAAYDITDSTYRLDAPGPTFDGRDLFAPVGAHLCAGAPIAELGDPIDPAGLMPAVMPVSGREGEHDEVIVAEVIWVDRFGNAQLNLDPDELDGLNWSIQIADRRRPARVVSHFDALTAGEVGLVTDSNGMVALVLNRASAARDLSATESTEVRLHPSAATGFDTPVTLGRGSV
ncbi:MAG: SAM-dependent chlorinase/fluorinase [Actinomycetota bacterium]